MYDKIVKLGVRTTDGMSMAGLDAGCRWRAWSSSTFTIRATCRSSSSPCLRRLCCFSSACGYRLAHFLVLTSLRAAHPGAQSSRYRRYAKKIFAKYWGKYTSMGDKFLDSVQGLKELKIFMADEKQHQRINESAEEFRVITMKVLVMQLASTTIMDLVAYGGAGAGIALAICGTAFWGLNPIAALFLCLVAVEFFLPLRAFGSAFHVAMNGASAGKKIISLLNAPDPEWGEKSVGGKEIKLTDVTFSYDGKRDVLKNVSMTFPEKGMTAIVGESGCGKSTVVNMLVGAFRPQSGEVTVGGKQLEKLSRENWYSHLSAVSYNTYIFNETRERQLQAGEGKRDRR